jgi:hypothetical protein
VFNFNITILKSQNSNMEDRVTGRIAEPPLEMALRGMSYGVPVLTPAIVQGFRYYKIAEGGESQPPIGVDLRRRGY